MELNVAPAENAEEPVSPAKTRWLAEYFSPLNGLLEHVEQEIAALLQDKESLLAEAGRYVAFGRGKRLRPTLLLLSAAVCKEAAAPAIKGAAAAEVIHTASLVHDDVVDEASWRRGKASARSVWGNKTSVLLGDYLISRAIEALLAMHDFSILDQILSVAQQMCRGQMTELAEAGTRLSENRYLEIVAGKTASLFGFCGRLGAVCAQASPETTDLLESHARCFGMAFQIADDIQDLIGRQADSGKPTNHDLRQRKMTLPLIFARRSLQGDERAQLEELLANPELSIAELAEIRRLALTGGGVDYARSVCRRYLDKALTSLHSLPALLPHLQPATTSPDTASASLQAYQALLQASGESFPLPVMA